jgi:hypothetical protein
MKKEDLLLLLLLAFLLLAAIITILRGGSQSRHGYGASLEQATDRTISSSSITRERTPWVSFLSKTSKT